MSETTTEATATATEETSTEQQPKPTETVDFWKQKAREQEKRAKDNADAAKRLSEIEESQKSEAEKAAERIAKAEAEVASVPSQVAAALRTYLVDLHKIDSDKADLFLTATDPELLLRQVNGLVADKGITRGNVAPKEGGSADTQGRTGDDEREFVRNLFGNPD